MDLAPSTWTELAAGPPSAVLVPLGSCEQHGPHLPLDTDTRIAVAVSTRAAAALDSVAVTPPVAFGASGEHAGFAGTLSIGTEVLAAVLIELGRSAQPEPGPHAVPLVFVNGHGGNRAALDRAVSLLRDEGRTVTSWSPVVDDGDAHAGRTETSLLLAIDPTSVRDERPQGATRPLAEIADQLRAEGVRAVAPNGVLGDSAGATEAEGARILDELVASLVARVRPLLGPERR